MKSYLTKALALLMALTMVFALAACGQKAAPAAETKPEAEPSAEAAPAEEVKAEPVVIEVATMYSTEDSHHAALEKANAYLQEKTEGRVSFNIYPNGTYGDQANCIQAVRMNTLDVFHTSYNADYVKEASALQGPYLFRDYAHWHLFTESSIKDEINAKIEEAMGCHIVETNHFGFREVVSTVKATTPEEFAKVKMRVVNVSPYPEAAVVLGATGTPIGIADVYMSLQTSVVQATENPLSQIDSMKFAEVTDYLIKTDHMLATEYWIMSNDCYDRLSDEDRAVVMEAFDIMVNYIEEANETAEEDYLAKFQNENGLELVEVDKQLFMDRLPEVFKDYPEWEAIYAQVQALA